MKCRISKLVLGARYTLCLKSEMRIKKFRHQVFQPVPSSISNKCDNTPILSFSNKKGTHKIVEINSEFHSNHLRK